MKLIIDTDIGDDYDDVFTLAAAVCTPVVLVEALSFCFFAGPP